MNKEAATGSGEGMGAGRYVDGIYMDNKWGMKKEIKIKLQLIY